LRPRSWFAALLGFAFWIWPPPVGCAQSSAETVLVVSREDGLLERRIGAELAAVGLLSIPHVTRTNFSEAELSDEVSRLGASGAAVVEVERSVVRIWLVTHGRLSAIAEVSLSNDPEASVALRAAELLHASLLEVRMNEPAPTPVEPVAAEAEPARPSTSPTAPQRTQESGRVTLELGVGAFGDPMGALILAGVRLGGSLELDTHVEIALVFVGPLHTQTFVGPEGSADALSGLGALTLRFPWIRDELLEPYAGIGGALCVLAAEGHPNGGRSGSSPSAISGGPSLEAGLRVRLAPPVALRADVHGSWLLAPFRISFDGRSVSRVGSLILSGSVGIDIEL
jgi:hypothetical protein